MCVEKTVQLESLILPVVNEAGLELFECKVRYGQGTANVEVLIDRPCGGISIDECARMNHAIVGLIEEDGLYGDQYTVTVASPGLDRPLRQIRDFIRVLGNTVDVVFSQEDGINISVTGVLRSADEQTVVLDAKAGEIQIPFARIQRAVIMI